MWDYPQQQHHQHIAPRSPHRAFAAAAAAADADIFFTPQSPPSASTDGTPEGFPFQVGVLLEGCLADSVVFG